VAEQRRIAELLGEIKNRRTAAHERLRRGRTLVDRFRNAVLAAAGSGRLTEAWRETHGTPEWQTASAGEVCAKVQSGTTPKVWHEGPGGIPFLKVYNVVNQQLDFGYRQHFISSGLHNGAMRRAQAMPGDVVMNIVGRPLGKVAIVTDEYPEWNINQALTLFRPSEAITTEWLYVFLRSGISVSEVVGKTRGSVGQVNISLTQCREFQIPMPSLAEQREIAGRVRAILATAERLAAKLDAIGATLERTCSAAITKALRGQLVPTDAALFEETGREFKAAGKLV
jgi:type I restriction enzyme S subunit